MKKVMNGAQAVVECMKREGVEHVFCVPGESYLPLMDSIYESGDIQLISTRHEGGASFMAEAYGKATRKPGVAMATRAVGGANLAIGIHTAYQDSTPMVVFLGQVHSKFRGREGFQEVELDRFFGHIAKWTVEIKDAERMPELVQRAFRIAKSGRPGPVVVALPEDVLVAEAEMSFGPVAPVPKPRPGASEVAAIEQLLANAKRPLILGGGGVIAADGEQALLKLAEALNIPVMAAFRRHDIFPNNHRLYVGHSGLGTFSPILDTLGQADVVLVVGTRLSEVTTQDYGIFPQNPKLIHIDIDAATLGKSYSPDLGVVADAREALEALLDMNVTCMWEEWAKERREAYELAGEGIAKEEYAVDNREIIRIMQEVLSEDTMITNDAGNFAGWLHSFYSFNRPKTYIGPTSGAMGYGLPAAIGAKVASPGKTVVSLSGDGGFMMTVQELETAARYNIPVIALVFNNSMYGTIRMHQEIHYPERVIGTDLGSVNFAELGTALGVQSVRVETNEDFKEALARAVASNAPALIEIMTNPERISVQSTISSIREKAKHRV
ncbi:acetolactate synthase [Aneurinibacillus migulanus]|uniref:thiamine pyrophosphate-dependent enzyme n=1 Tax=Aneurinibacillus migulanus TaxID=47500 RepID=UPI0005BAEE94|nr:thiamine pyrophosphate-dependent enzyme [Aneurinibacillus migulanus]KIV59528.1 acetolactate synthase [Aneurinibacillus migulanus]KPD07567.1 acetolactate synthase [Aneurinibacillus migulanus]MCP1357523.1 thiamine pyrophosphate-binding protein [Aneurinibacillus migulanus]CEH28015.1 Thiamine pyrophosphate protein [Aneurinibacillus migulanus]